MTWKFLYRGIPNIYTCFLFILVEQQSVCTTTLKLKDFYTSCVSTNCNNPCVILLGLHESSSRLIFSNCNTANKNFPFSKFIIVLALYGWFDRKTALCLVQVFNTILQHPWSIVLQVHTYVAVQYWWEKLVFRYYHIFN